MLLFVNSLLIFFSIKFIWFHKKGPHELIKGRITTISFSLFISWAQKTTFSQNHNFLCAKKRIDLLRRRACSEHKEAKIFWMKTPKCSAGFISAALLLYWRGRRFFFFLLWFIYPVNWMNYLMLPKDHCQSGMLSL